MHRWERSHGHIGVTAPSWLTFEVHRPYFDGGETPLTAIQARGPAHAARLFAKRDTETPQFGMIMPSSYRQLLTEESRLVDYRVTRPTDLPDELAQPAWRTMADAFRRRADLDDAESVGLASWLLAAALTDAVLELAPEDRATTEPLQAQLQYCRARALFAREGFSDATRSAFAVLVDSSSATTGHMVAIGGWAYLIARHAPDWSAAKDHAVRAWELFEELSGDLGPFRRAVWQARAVLRDVTIAERDGHLDAAWALLEQAGASAATASATTDDEKAVATELRRRLIDRRVEIAVKRGDDDAEDAALSEGLALDPTCVKIRMQVAQSAERRGTLEAALDGYLTAARLGPFGTAYALLHAASCAGRLGQDEFARVLAERAFRAAPRSERTRSALATACEATGDTTLAEVVRRPVEGYRGNWHYRMYGAYFNLGESHSPCLYANIPALMYKFAVAGVRHRISLQRILPPAFRGNLLRESGLVEFACRHPAELPADLRTAEWDQLCDWVAGFDMHDPMRQYLTSRLLFRLGFHRLVLDLVPPRSAEDLSEPIEFSLYRQRDLVEYAASQGRRTVLPTQTFAMADNPKCPLHTRLAIATSGVVFAARETRVLEDAERWRARAQEYLDALLASDEYSQFEKDMLHSRFYRGVGFVPFMRGDRGGTVDEMSRAEELARAVPTHDDWEEMLKRENLHACLESRSKEAFGLGDIELGHARTEEFLALDPYDPKSHIEFGESLVKQERYAEAAESYLRAARLGPLGTALAYNMAGECFDKAGEPAPAEDCFVQALRIDPHAISAARGWRRVSSNALAGEYADQLEEWGAERSGKG